MAPLREIVIVIHGRLGHSCRWLPICAHVASRRTAVRKMCASLLLLGVKIGLESRLTATVAGVVDTAAECGIGVVVFDRRCVVGGRVEVGVGTRLLLKPKTKFLEFRLSSQEKFKF